MKKNYIVLFPVIILICFFIIMYFIDIPSPSVIITENYELNIK